MSTRHATLSVLTPEAARPLPPAAMLRRCALLGAPACLFDASGSLVDADGAPGSLMAWLRSGPIQERLRGTLASSGVPRPGVASAESRRDPIVAAAAPVLTTIFPGCVVTVIAHHVGATPAGFTTALLLSPEAMTDAVFLEGCAAAELDPGVVARQALPLARFGGAAADLAGRALAAAGADLETIEDQRTALEGFTSQLTDSYDTMDLLYSVGRSMREPSRPEHFLSFVCERLLATMSFRWVAVRFGSEAWIASGLRGQLVFDGDLPAGESIVGEAALSQMSGTAFPQVVEEVPHLSTREARQVLVQPLFCKGKPAGVLAAGGKHGEDPDISSYDIQLIEAAAGYINAFSENVALYEDQHNLFMGTLQALTAAIDAKDRYTCGHSERVAHLARALALRTGMDKAQAERVHIAGLVHDVGKIGVPEAVLCKAGKLTPTEFDAIKRHPAIGHTILRDIALLADVLPGVLHHHERIDGRGYPHGLAGTNIPYIARLLSVADTFDAMSSTRSYRAAMPRERVLAEIEACAGTQLDPDLARAFLTMDLSEYDALVARHAALHMAVSA
jgi:HD-GYP domain-containing protein (c-di-GMP phosphodiesterase class II)